MAITTQITDETVVRPTLWRFTVDDYHRMAEVGILMGDDRVELIDGQIVAMNAIRPAHAACVKRLTRALHRLFGDEPIIGVQDPVRLDEHTEPQPDISLLRVRDDFYTQSLPQLEDVVLLIEVADTTTVYDRNAKLPLYASAGIAEAWIIDVQGAAIERHAEPTEGAYRVVSRVGRGHDLQSTVLPDLVLRTNEILGAELG